MTIVSVIGHYCQKQLARISRDACEALFLGCVLACVTSPSAFAFSAKKWTDQSTGRAVGNTGATWQTNGHPDDRPTLQTTTGKCVHVSRLRRRASVPNCENIPCSI